jgi:hypothetical protein
MEISSHHTTMNGLVRCDGELINPASVCVFVAERFAPLEGAIIAFRQSSHPSIKLFVS